MVCQQMVSVLGIKQSLVEVRLEVPLIVLDVHHSRPLDLGIDVDPILLRQFEASDHDVVLPRPHLKRFFLYFVQLQQNDYLKVE